MVFVSILTLVSVRNTQKNVVEKPRGKKPLRRPKNVRDVNNERDVKVIWMGGQSELRQNRDQWQATYSKLGNKHSGFIKGGGCFDKLRDCQILKLFFVFCSNQFRFSFRRPASLAKYSFLFLSPFRHMQGFTLL
jgi:hypothetical protein